MVDAALEAMPLVNQAFWDSVPGKAHRPTAPPGAHLDNEPTASGVSIKFERQGSMKVSD